MHPFFCVFFELLELCGLYVNYVQYPHIRSVSKGKMTLVFIFSFNY